MFVLCAWLISYYYILSNIIHNILILPVWSSSFSKQVQIISIIHTLQDIVFLIFSYVFFFNHFCELCLYIPYTKRTCILLSLFIYYLLGCSNASGLSLSRRPWFANNRGRRSFLIDSIKMKLSILIFVLLSDFILNCNKVWILSYTCD